MLYKGDIIMIETKELYVGTTDRKNEEIKIRGCFGWEYVEERHHGRSGGLHILLKRDTEMKNYSKLASLENEYDDCKKRIKVYNKIVEEPGDLLILAALFILFIFPLVLYCMYKSNQKKEIAENNAKLHKEMNSILEEAKSLLQMGANL